MRSLRAAGIVIVVSSGAMAPNIALSAETAASDATQDTLAEVVVTAEKRTETVQDVPVSITVLPSEELVRQGVQNVSDLSGLSASLEFTSLTANTPGTAAFIRGIGTETVGGSTTTGSVAMVLDGVTLGNTAVSDIFDVNHVEVLKGPQGTLFGSSVSAGVINVITNAPDPTKFSSQVNLEYASASLGSQYQRTSLRGIINLPLTETSALRVAAHSDTNNGVFDNVYSGALSNEPDNGVRVRYLMQATDSITINVIFDYSKAMHDNYPALTYRYAPTTPPYNSLSAALTACGVTPGDSNFSYCSDVRNAFWQLDKGGSLQFDWNLGGATVTSVTADRFRTNYNIDGLEALPVAIAEDNFALGSKCLFFNCVPIFSIYSGLANNPQSQNRQQVSEELRIASQGSQKLDWLGGIFYQHYKMLDNEPGGLIANFGGGPGPVVTNWYANVKTEEYAAFANLTYHLLPSTRLIAGGRITHSNVDESQYYPSNFGNNNTYSRDTAESKFTWRLGVQQDLFANAMAYAMVSTGFKAQEIRDQIVENGQLGNEVYPEEPTNYEVGLKTSLLDNRLAIDGDVFYERVKNFQGQLCNPNNQGTITCVAQNVPTVNSKGVELDIFGRPITGLTLNMSGAYTDAVYPTGYNGSDGASLAGDQLEYVSKIKFTLSAEERVPVTDTYALVIGVDNTYRSSQRLYTQSEPWFVAPASDVVNARIGVSSLKDKWSAYFFARNLGAERFPRQIYPTPFQSGPTGQPGGLWEVLDATALRLVGFQLEAKF